MLIQNTVISLNGVYPKYRVNRYSRKFETFPRKVENLVELNVYFVTVKCSSTTAILNVFVHKL